MKRLMVSNDFAPIISLYTGRMRKYGIGQKALGWLKNRGHLRFEILCSLWDLNHASILDAGCGFGDFYGFLRKRGVEGFTYLGVDINPALIDVAASLYPDAGFQAANIADAHLPQGFDYGFASGLFNDKLYDNAAFIRQGLNMLHAHCRKGFAANFLSDRVDYFPEHTSHANPAVILDICYDYSNNIVLRNDYMPYEFTVFVNKASQVDPERRVYSEFLRYL